jgi:Protein of unknown function (DUF2950)
MEENMNLFRFEARNDFSIGMMTIFILAFLFSLLYAPTGHSAQMKKQETFVSPEEAFKTLVEAIKMNNKNRLSALLGTQGKELLSTEADYGGQVPNRFLAEYGEKNRLEKIGQTEVVLHVGPEDWPWPIPLVKVEGRWRFDIEKGEQEILARRIGGNEVSAIQVCLAYVDAQREYAQEHPTKNGLGEYAQKLMSDPGKKDGLCWITTEGEKQSPIGPLLADACPTTSSGTLTNKNPLPYYGYYYKVLTRQGKAARGGAYNYIVDGKMIGGFALVAYPAFYRRTGIMTFIINQDGQVYEKNLGEKTENIAMTMKNFNPDKTWRKVD